MIISNNDPTERFSAEHAKILNDREKCDDWRTYSECGWHCVVGYFKGRRVVHAHCESADQFNRMMSRGQPSRSSLVNGLYDPTGIYYPD